MGLKKNILIAMSTMVLLVLSLVSSVFAAADICSSYNADSVYYRYLDEDSTIEFSKLGDKGGLFSFRNKEGILVQLGLYLRDNGNIIWGNDEEVGDRTYFQGESCTGEFSVTECKGAKFLVVDNYNLHVYEIDDIDTTENQISLIDLTYSISRNNLDYADGSRSEFVMPVYENKIVLKIDEESKRVKFVDLDTGNRNSYTDKGLLLLTDDNVKLLLANSKPSNLFQGVMVKSSGANNLILTNPNYRMFTDKFLVQGAVEGTEIKFKTTYCRE